ncbi:MAG: hypothetical protein B5M53_01070 [Candidatus Cloacimonas sp. 4484_209]|nr:MAG: hypothetical protein B5M53_01070 [Candidatus Cloacimonas sp. 4484_209]
MAIPKRPLSEEERRKLEEEVRKRLKEEVRKRLKEEVRKRLKERGIIPMGRVLPDKPMPPVRDKPIEQDKIAPIPPEKPKCLIETPEFMEKHKPSTKRPVPPGIQDKIENERRKGEFLRTGRVIPDEPHLVRTGKERRYYEEQLKKQGVPEEEYKGKPIYVRPTRRGTEVIIGDPRKKVEEKPQFPEAKRGFVTLKSGKRVKVQKEKSWEKIEGWLKSGKSRYRRLREKRDPTFIEEVLGLKFTQYAASRPLGQADIERIAKGKIFTADLLRLGVSSKKEAKKLAKDLLSGRKRWSDISVTIYAPIEVPSTLAGKFSGLYSYLNTEPAEGFSALISQRKEDNPNIAYTPPTKRVVKIPKGASYRWGVSKEGLPTPIITERRTIKKPQKTGRNILTEPQGITGQYETTKRGGITKPSMSEVIGTVTGIPFIPGSVRTAVGIAVPSVTAKPTPLVHDPVEGLKKAIEDFKTNLKKEEKKISTPELPSYINPREAGLFAMAWAAEQGGLIREEKPMKEEEIIKIGDLKKVEMPSEEFFSTTLPAKQAYESGMIQVDPSKLTHGMKEVVESIRAEKEKALELQKRGVSEITFKEGGGVYTLPTEEYIRRLEIQEAEAIEVGTPKWTPSGFVKSVITGGYIGGSIGGVATAGAGGVGAIPGAAGGAVGGGVSYTVEYLAEKHLPEKSPFQGIPVLQQLTGREEKWFDIPKIDVPFGGTKILRQEIPKTIGGGEWRTSSTWGVLSFIGTSAVTSRAVTSAMMKAKLPKTTMKAEVKGTGIQDVEKGRQMIGYKIKGEIRTRTPFGEKVTTIKPAEKSMIQLSQEYPGTWKSEPYTLKGVSGEVMKYPKGAKNILTPSKIRSRFDILEREVTTYHGYLERSVPGEIRGEGIVIRPASYAKVTSPGARVVNLQLPGKYTKVPEKATPENLPYTAYTTQKFESTLIETSWHKPTLTQKIASIRPKKWGIKTAKEVVEKQPPRQVSGTGFQVTRYQGKKVLGKIPEKWESVGKDLVVKTGEEKTISYHPYSGYGRSSFQVKDIPGKGVIDYKFDLYMFRKGGKAGGGSGGSAGGSGYPVLDVRQIQTLQQRLSGELSSQAAVTHMRHIAEASKSIGRVSTGASLFGAITSGATSTIPKTRGAESQIIKPARPSQTELLSQPHQKAGGRAKLSTKPLSSTQEISSYQEVSTRVLPALGRHRVQYKSPSRGYKKKYKKETRQIDFSETIPKPKTIVIPRPTYFTPEKQPEITIPRPAVTPKQPEITIPRPAVTPKQPEITIPRQPEITIPRPIEIPRQPEITIPKTPQSITQPRPQTPKQPQITIPEVVTIPKQPEVTALKPSEIIIPKQPTIPKTAEVAPPITMPMGGIEIISPVPHIEEPVFPSPFMMGGYRRYSRKKRKPWFYWERRYHLLSPQEMLFSSFSKNENKNRK